MSNVAKVAGAAANTLTTPPNVEDVFSTYLYTGNSSTNTITNGIDLSSEGGMVWLHGRSNATGGIIYDTERGVSKALLPHTTAIPSSTTNGLTAFNSDGFTLTNTPNTENFNGYTYASWTFRKAPKFFDVVTYTGDGTSNRQISHDLGSVPGAVLVKRTNSAREWAMYHRGVDATAPEDYYLALNTTAAKSTLQPNYWERTQPTSSVFTVGNDTSVNSSGDSYVAYLFAHNDGDGEFGPTGDQDIIKCGSYTGNGSTTGPEINLGWEAQWVLIKNASTGGHYWHIYDVMRGWVVGGNESTLLANTSDAENGLTGAANYSCPTSTGFRIESASGEVNTNGNTYIYIAIRRGPMAVPESATDVFDIDLANPGSSTITTPFPVDLSLGANRAGSAANFSAIDRLRGGKGLRTNVTDAEQNVTVTLDSMDSFSNGIFGTGNHLFYSWKRAPNYFDVVAYTGNGTAGRTVSHNLGVAPEMMWIKSRDQARNWEVYHSGIASDAETDYINLNQRYAAQDNANQWNDTKPTSSVFSLGTSASVNNSSEDFIAYLFASLSGVSKVGSYTGNGTNQTIDCGFSSGARFILIKRSDQGSGIIDAGDWHVFDTERGVIAGNDPYLELNTTNVEVTSEDAVDPDNSGFIVNEVSGSNINTSGNTYIFYAVA